MIKEQIYDYFATLESTRKLNESEELHFAPSYITKCGRQIFFKKRQVPPSNPISAHAYIKMELGKIIHEKIQDILIMKGCWKEGEVLKEYRDNSGLLFHYRVDGKIEINGEKSVLEIKTVYSTGWKTVEAIPNEEHVLQLYAYMVFENIPTGILLYIGRDNGYMTEYQFSIDKMDEYKIKFSKHLARLAEIKKCIESNVLPGRDYKIQMKVISPGTIAEKFQKDKIQYKSDWQCNYCQWKNLCWKDEYRKINDHKFYINGEYVG
jgi:CRISPR/Cas system-associated exonuclease Cas4 (RecB family)